MARISQYKALGTKMGGYKSTLSKVQSLEYAKKHEDFKAQEKKSLYGEIGATVSNIIGIADETRRLKSMQPLDKPGRPEIKLEQQESEMIGDVGMDEEAGLGRFQDFDTSAPIPGLESSYMQGMKGEVELPNIPSPPERVDFTGARTAARGATESMRLSPDTTAGALPMGGAFFEEAGGARGTQDASQQGYPMWGQDADVTYPTAEEVARYQPADRGREFAGAFSNLGQLKDMEINLPENLKPSYPSPEEIEKYQPAPGRGYRSSPEPQSPSPITDDMAFDTLTDTTLGDFDMGTLPPQSPLERQLISKMKERGQNITTQQIDQLVNEFASVEAGGQNIRQELAGEVGTGKGTGKGSGFFQFETGKGQGFETALNRVKNMYKGKLEGGERSAPSWVNEALKHGDPTKLSKEQQRELLIANLYQQEDHSSRRGKGTDFSVLERAFENMDFSELWAKRHWKGGREGTSKYEEKISQYQRDRERFRF